MSAAGTFSTPVVLRSARRLVVGRLCVAGASGVLAVSGRLLELTWLTRLLAAVAVVQLVQAVYAWTGRVSLGPDALRSRGLLIPRRIPWAQLWDCELRTTPFGRHVRVRPRGRKKSVRLPVPTSPYLFPDPGFEARVDLVRAWSKANAGSEATSVRRTGGGSRPLGAVVLAAVLVAALALDRPWDWSVGADGAVAVSLPDLCHVSSAAVHDIVGYQTGSRQSYPGRGETRYLCVWGVDDESEQAMFVAVDLFHRLGPYGATWRAHDAFHQFDQIGDDTCRRDLPAPIGDESVALNVLSHNDVVVRRANALVEVYSHGPTRDVIPEAAVIARDVADHIQVEPRG